ncbi:bifunctional heptose 7-phosphate kinase/heptose 1-phosphate adenyltransferase [Labedella phragmitis]|uniref:Bifunctional heptose 7-phosphate kinase/heptose 1-phosphate adenyltransferase n=1 Tax=Labedella phragmitis TaxID=2498849 RepID=A0A3S4A4Y7_9MICO|nr:PfkB family carbohydrate kinase [Labedella phragmitis]RWZ51528.1 bifunctional heptose 7-phosphate kinase/heptose 1-phosphate adenyltransferase [Labedella phragmitis]
MRIVVVGDALLDVDVDGSAERLSPDAPVPVVDLRSRSVRAGGAGLVATMLRRDGIDVSLVSSIAADDHGAELVGALDGVRVVTAGSGDPTPVKTRVRASGHAIARLDEACGPPGELVVDGAMLAEFEGADAIVVADYGRGMAAHPAIRAVVARRAGTIPVVWDPHPRGAVPVAGVTIVTPNRGEAAAFAGRSVDGVPDAAAAGERLLEDWRVERVAVTLGEGGAVLSAPGRLPLVATARAVDSADPCGAGDRLAATLALELAAGASAEDALRAAVARASAFLATGGVAGLELPDNAAAIGGEAAEALAVARATRERGGTVVATGGCFDLLHAGHARTLAAARSLGDCLIVCLNSDSSVRRLKGRERPLIRQEDRVDLLLALECVDAVLVFDEDTPEEAIARIEPDLWVKGGDYVAADLPETRVLAERGGRVVTVPYIPARSTSALAEALARVG